MNILYNPENKRILKVIQGNVPDSLLVNNLGSGERFTELPSDTDASTLVDKLYDDNTGQIQDKSVQSITVSSTTVGVDGVENVTLKGIEPQSTIDIRIVLDTDTGNTTVTVSDSSFRFKTTVPGTYTLTVKHPLYLDTVVTITASAS